MKISINVPTYKRAGMIETFNILPGADYWVHESEVEKYKKAHQGIKIRILSDKIKGNIATVRNFILHQTKGHDGSLQVDDDMDYVGYWENKTEVRLANEKDIRDMILRYSHLAKEWGVFLWGINVNADKQVYREYTPFSTLSYISASFSCFLKGNDLAYDERFSLKEDYDMTLKQINKHRRVLRINKYFYRKKGAEQTGGCAMYRNVQKETDQIKLLQRKWGSNLVKIDDGKSRSHSTSKKRNFDINPLIRVPIKGV